MCVFIMAALTGGRACAEDLAHQEQGTVPSYEEVSGTYDYSRGSGKLARIDLNAAKDEKNNTVRETEYLSQKGLIWKQDSAEKYELPFFCEDGLYAVILSYLPLKEDGTDLMASIKVDGSYLFQEMEAVEFPRSWAAESENHFDKNGNEYASYLVQQEELLEEPVRDRKGLCSEELLLRLKGGNHVLELGYLSGSMLITGITFVPAKELKDYDEYRKEKRGKNYQGKAVMTEGEDAVRRSSRDIPCYTHNDAAMSPYEPGKTRINAFGGNYWYKGNSAGTWEFSVPEDGYYKISMRVIQNHEGLISGRQIRIDGEVPFQEMSCYEFTYEDGFRTEALGKEEPYLFWLTGGSHTFTLSAAAEHMRKPVRRLEELSRQISETVHDIQLITGTSPDPNFDYELHKKAPELVEELEKAAEGIEQTACLIEEICAGSPAVTSTLHSNSETLRSLTKKIRTLPENLSMVTTIQGDLNDAASTLQSQPLGIDWISFQNPEEELYEPRASFFEKAGLMLSDFIKSFQDTEEDDGKEENTINLWVARDKEWGNLIQQLIREDFEERYGIEVRINVLPSGNTTVVNGASPLLLSVVSGNTPDIALGCDGNTPVELAIRGQLSDLGQFPDFEEVAARFPETTLRSLSYDGACYGVPETMDLPVMVYRTDILEQNGIEVPDTWEDLWRYTLPQLAQADANFYMGSSSIDMYASFLFQNGGDFYDEDGMCTLNRDAAIEAFDQWTKSFVQYSVPQSASFYNEMRTGTLPAGICTLKDYMELLTYAGELTGKLKAAPIPGTADKDGNILRYGAGNVTSAVIFNKCKNKEACWTFLKWWTSEEIQSRFASGIEMNVGATGRWFSANTEAFYDLPWSVQEREVLKEWMPWYRNVRNVLGGYYTSRAVTNAWTRTVMSGVNARDSIEQGYEEIALQIERKRREYGKAEE